MAKSIIILADTDEKFLSPLELKFLEEQLSYIEQILPPIPSKRKSR